jgi:AhpD family alkylhydroperoxidase
MHVSNQSGASAPSYEAFRELAPAAYATLIALGKAVDDAGLDKGLTELVKLRVSQINGCAFCLQLHLNVARKVGVDAAKLDLIAVWRDAGAFSVREMAALTWAEQLTAMAESPVPEHAFAALREHFSENEARSSPYRSRRSTPGTGSPGDCASLRPYCKGVDAHGDERRGADRLCRPRRGRRDLLWVDAPVAPRIWPTLTSFSRDNAGEQFHHTVGPEDID